MMFEMICGWAFRVMWETIKLSVFIFIIYWLTGVISLDNALYIVYIVMAILFMVGTPFILANGDTKGDKRK